MQTPGNLDIYWREKNDYIPYDYSQQNVAGASSSAMGPPSTAEVPYYPENFNNNSSSNQDVVMKDIKIETTSYFRDRSPDQRRREDEYRERHERKRDKDRGEREREREKERDRDADRSTRRKESERDRGKSRERSRDRSRERRRTRDDRDDRDRESRKSRRSRRKSRSPSLRRYSPTSRYRSRSRSVTPINKRVRKLNNWDVPPPGYEGMTSEQVKATGHFPLPGQAAVGATMKPPSAPETPLIHIPGMDPSRAALMMGMTHELPPRPKVSQGAAGPVAQTASLARQARRLYVGNIPYGIDEFRAPEEATAAMAFDGITFQGQSLKIRRPKDYQAPPGHDQEPPPIHVPGVVSTNVPDSPHKIFIGGLPTYLNDEQVIELLKSFGELRAFNLVKDSLTGVSKGFAFCEYVDPTVTDLACQGLNNMELGDRKLVVQRASVGSTKNTGVAITSLPPSLLIPANNGEMQPTRILQLLNMVTPEELIDDDEYAGMFINDFYVSYDRNHKNIPKNISFLLILDIFDDVHEECSKYGKIVDMKIPRPTQTGLMAGIGKIFVRYERIEETGVALRALAGRKFAERTVLTSYIDEDRYLADDF
ncbi:2574_t:CDS:2 [Ambispora gerdemannii]|uniref:2574_t:CDS:1 n=1 Tax=Ambispora gerdemannii TaxID=144530 RepID=A0A9N9FEM0_9GLOM|nr:2574_t:CDS:2 [Ambispora gerdemannii]